MECVASLHKVDKPLKCICRQCAAADSEKESCNDGGKAVKRTPVAAGEWFGAIPSQSILSTTHIARPNIAVRPSKSELQWMSHRFHINKFFQQYTKPGSKVDDQ